MFILVFLILNFYRIYTYKSKGCKYTNTGQLWTDDSFFKFFFKKLVFKKFIPTAGDDEVETDTIGYPVPPDALWVL